MVEALFEKFPERKTEWPKQNMLGRLSKPEEYRGAAAFLISDASSFMTGEWGSRVGRNWYWRFIGSDLRMDGGHAAWWFND
jgi:NAD(P)-dependent dehydrogenase (short-subunit alcohol dehydrogenase family)